MLETMERNRYVDSLLGSLIVSSIKSAIAVPMFSR